MRCVIVRLMSVKVRYEPFLTVFYNAANVRFDDMFLLRREQGNHET